MARFFRRVASVTGLYCGLSPIFLMFGIAARDQAIFFHYWFMSVIICLTVTMVSIVLMQVVDS